MACGSPPDAAMHKAQSTKHKAPLVVTDIVGGGSIFFGSSRNPGKNQKKVGTLPCRSCGAAMVDSACEPDKRGVLESIAGKPAPTVSRSSVKNQKKPAMHVP